MQLGISYELVEQPFICSYKTVQKHFLAYVSYHIRSPFNDFSKKLEMILMELGASLTVRPYREMLQQ